MFSAHSIRSLHPLPSQFSDRSSLLHVFLFFTRFFLFYTILFFLHDSFFLHTILFFFFHVFFFFFFCFFFFFFIFFFFTRFFFFFFMIFFFFFHDLSFWCHEHPLVQARSSSKRPLASESDECFLVRKSTSRVGAFFLQCLHA